MAATASSAKLDKKQKRKELNQKLEELRRLLKEANEDDDLLRHFPSFQSYCRNGLACDIASHNAASLPQQHLQWALDLCRHNMQALYEPVWGWNDRKKKRQLEAPESRFLVAYERCSSSSTDCTAAEASADNSDGAGDPMHGGSLQNNSDGDCSRQPVAYVNFRFDQEGSVPVVYCYELQLEERAQRKGLGKFLVRLLELLGAKYGMQMSMLTVMKGNTSARSFYACLGYSLDPSSPVEEECGYQILSRSLVRHTKAGAPASSKASGTLENGAQRQRGIAVAAQQ